MAIKIYPPEPIATYNSETGRVKYALCSPIYRGWSRILEVAEQAAVNISVGLYLIDNRYHVLLHHHKEHFGTFIIPQDEFPDIEASDITVVFNNLLEQAHQNYTFHPFADLARAFHKATKVDDEDK